MSAPVKQASTATNWSRDDLLAWVNSLTHGNYTKVEQLCNGVAYCQIMNLVFPDCIPQKKVKFYAKFEHDFLYNLNLLQNALAHLKFQKPVPSLLLVKGRFLDNFEFLQWFKVFCDQNQTTMVDESKKAQSEPKIPPAEKPQVRYQQVKQDPLRKQALQHDEHKQLGLQSEVLDQDDKVATEKVEALKETLTDLASKCKDVELQRSCYFTKLVCIEKVIQSAIKNGVPVDWTQLKNLCSNNSINKTRQEPLNSSSEFFKIEEVSLTDSLDVTVTTPTPTPPTTPTLTPIQSRCNSPSPSVDTIHDNLDNSKCYGMLYRIPVPPDNSCMFTSLRFVMNGKRDTIGSYEMRAFIANVISSDKETYNDALLGRPNDDYCQWIIKPDAWGGAIELSIFSEYFGIEVDVIFIGCKTVQRFGEDKNYEQRVFLYYTGTHYDPLLMNTEESAVPITKFSVNDMRVFEQAEELARREMIGYGYGFYKEQFQCEDCGMVFVCPEQAFAHIQSTGHSECTSM